MVDLFVFYENNFVSVRFIVNEAIPLVLYNESARSITSGITYF